MSTDDLAPLLHMPPAGGLRYGQGTILAWNVETFENEVDWNGVRLVNLPVLAGTVALTFFPGQSVGLLGWDGGDGGPGSWWLLGRLVIPQETPDDDDDDAGISQTLFETISANVINADVINVGELNVEGQSVEETIEEAEPPPVGTIKVTYNASWSANYKGNNTRNTFNERPHQGFYSSLNGNQRSLIGFPSSTIQSDHGSRTITRVRVFLYYDHWYFNSGGTAVIGHHGHNSPPSSFSATTDEQRRANWPKPGGKWTTYVHSPQQWATGTKRGIALGPGPSTNKLYYGRARGADQSNRPRLEIISSG